MKLASSMNSVRNGHSHSLASLGRDVFKFGKNCINFPRNTFVLAWHCFVLFFL